MVTSDDAVDSRVKVLAARLDARHAKARAPLSYSNHVLLLSDSRAASHKLRNHALSGSQELITISRQMAFRRRNEGVRSTIAIPSDFTKASASSSPNDDPNPSTSTAGVRTSPNLGLPTVSTGTASLDSLLGARAGLPLGSSLLISETSSTDYAGVLVKCFAAEGALHGHKVHVVGFPPAWIGELPGVADDKEPLRRATRNRDSDDKMKIAWRYQNLPSSEVEKVRGGCRPRCKTYSYTSSSEQLIHVLCLSSVSFFQWKSSPFRRTSVLSYI